MTVDFIILGAGLAGLSLADSLVDRKHSVLVLDTRQVGGGASGTPIGLVNPATGRRGKKVWNVEEALPTLFRTLSDVSEYSDTSFFVRQGVLRPARDQEMASEMHKRFKQASWPPGWCYWLTKKEIRRFHAHIHCVKGGLWLPVGMAVHVPRYLNALSKKITKQKGALVTRSSYTYHRTPSSNWLIVTDRGEKVKGRNLIFATGAGTLHQPIWDGLPLNAVKGQVAKFHLSSSLNFDYSISSKGYIAHTDQNSFVVGSTYEHDYNIVSPTKKGEQHLRKILKSILPRLSDYQLQERWAGVRVSASDHKPVVGPHPHYHNLFLMVGLGSKGLLHGKYLAEKLLGYLLNGSPIPEKASISRYRHLL